MGWLMLIVGGLILLVMFPHVMLFVAAFWLVVYGFDRAMR